MERPPGAGYRVNLVFVADPAASTGDSAKPPGDRDIPQLIRGPHYGGEQEDADDGCRRSREHEAHSFCAGYSGGCL